MTSIGTIIETTLLHRYPCGQVGYPKVRVFHNARNYMKAFQEMAPVLNKMKCPTGRRPS